LLPGGSHALAAGAAFDGRRVRRRALERQDPERSPEVVAGEDCDGPLSRHATSLCLVAQHAAPVRASRFHRVRSGHTPASRERRRPTPRPAERVLAHDRGVSVGVLYEWGDSDTAAQMATARSYVQLCGRAKVTGVAFFDFNHGQTGVAPNAIELHPILGFHCLTS
jgi:hypothetical protein